MRDEVMRELQCVSFAMDELRLFIDTHPDCSEAIALFNEYAAKRKELVSRHNEEISPLGGYDAEDTDCWRWVNNSAWKGGMN